MRWFLALVVGLLAVPAAFAQQFPLFDAHIHYSQPAWDVYPPEAALAILNRAGVRRALVSSTPDDGTLKLYEKAPRLVVPFLRPYRTRDDMGTWTQDPTILPYLEGRLARGIYKGIGEFHLSVGEAGSPVVRGTVALAARHNLFLHAHADETAVEELLRLDPRVNVLWAHAGMSSGPEAVGRLLDRYPTLRVELALRSDVAPDGRLDPAWRDLFLRHSDRLMVGTDTWINSQWENLPEILDRVRVWLRQLPRDAAERIGSLNAERLFSPP